MEKLNLTPNAYLLHMYLLEYCVGEQNARHAKQICKDLHISPRYLRTLRASINSERSDIHRKALTSSKGYYVATNDENLQDQYKSVGFKKFYEGLFLMKEGLRLVKHSDHDGQMILKLTKHTKEVLEIGA